MRNFIMLFRANMQLSDFVYGKSSKDKTSGKKLGTVALAVFVILALSLVSGTMSYGMLELMHPYGLGAFVPAMFYIAGSILTLMTAVGYSRAVCLARLGYTAVNADLPSDAAAVQAGRTVCL